MTLWKRMLIGHMIIICAAIVGVLGTFLMDYIIEKTTHPDRIAFIFAVLGTIFGFSSVGIAITFYTNNFGDGFNKKDKQ